MAKVLRDPYEGRMRMFIGTSLLLVLVASAGCDASQAAPAGKTTAKPASKAGSATDPWAAGPSANAGSVAGSATSSTIPAKAEGAKKGSSSGEGNWQCTASSSVRVCGFAGACNYQMVFGNGWGKDRFFASKQAKSSCEASARAKGATAVCVVQCSVR